jgi:maltooligosyltrehalose trehalohydrolase
VNRPKPAGDGAPRSEVVDRAPGASTCGNGQARFRLWAPDARQAVLEIPGHPPLAMAAQDGGVFECLAPARHGDRYRFGIDGRAPVPDPASRWQPDGVHGASAVLDHDVYRWTCEEWRGRAWPETVIYELHVGASGGFRGVERQLEAIAALGITAIELMPVGEFAGTRNWGYDGVLPYAPDSSYGTPDELKSLVDRAHSLGLMVFLDVVYNHFGPEGNGMPAIAPAFFRAGHATPWGDAIDFAQPEVQRYFIANALMWLLDYRFDGLRIDAVHAIEPRSFLDELRQAVAAAIPADRHVHLVLENADNQASLLRRGCRAQWNDDFHNALHVLLTGETDGYYADFAAEPTRLLARTLEQGFAYQGERTPRGALRGEPSADLPPHAFVLFAQNHDQIGNRAFGERLVSLAPAAAVRVAMALVALAPSIPLFFMGEPWGARQPFLYFSDFGPPLDAQVREGRRKEFAGVRGFDDPDRIRAIPDPNAWSTFESSQVDIAQADAHCAARWRAWFVGLLALRRGRIVPRLEQARSLGARVLGHGAIAAAWTLGPGMSLHIAFNLGTTPVALPVPRGVEIIHAENCAPGCSAACANTGFSLTGHALLAWIQAEPES